MSVCVTLWPIRCDDRSINFELAWIRVRLAGCDAEIIARYSTYIQSYIYRRVEGGLSWAELGEW